MFTLLVIYCHIFTLSHAEFCHVCCYRAVLGGSTEDDQTSFLSRNAKLVTFTMDSTFNWVRDARSLLIDDSVPRTEPSMDVLERAQFSLEVLDGSFFCLKTIEDETKLVPATLAAIFLI